MSYDEIGERIQKRIYQFANDFFGFDFDVYLKNNNNREFWGFVFEVTKTGETENETKFHEIFGKPTEEFLKIVEDPKYDYSTIFAGYRSNIGSESQFKHLNLNTDVFMIRKEIISLPEETDALIIHELCHLYIQSNLQSQYFLPKPCWGNEDPFKVPSSMIENLGDHDEIFYSTLISVCLKAAYSNSSFVAKSLIALSLKYNGYQ